MNITKIEKQLTEKNILLIIFSLAIILLLTPNIVRIFTHNSALIGQTPYYNLRIAEQIKTNIPYYDSLSYTGRPYLFNPYHFILALLPLNIASKTLPIIFSLLSVLLLHLILKKFKINKLMRFLTLFIFILSPPFLYASTSSHSFTIFILLSAFFLFLGKKTKALSFFLFILIPFLGLLPLTIALLALLSYKLYNKQKGTNLVITSMLIVSFFYYVHLYFVLGFPSKLDFIKTNIFQVFISDLGSTSGFSTFAIILALLGLAVTWKNKNKLKYIYLSIIILFASLFYFDFANIYLNLIMPVFASIVFFRLIKMRWQLKIIRDLTILILICGFLFSSASYMIRTINLGPDKETVNALEWLKNKEGIVFSHYNNGIWINTIAEKQTIIDSRFVYAPEPKKRFEDSEFLFYSTDLEKTKKVLNDYNIRYIFINKEMKTIWKKPEQGLLLLLTNQKTFENIYEERGVEIWEYIKND